MHLMLCLSTLSIHTYTGVCGSYTTPYAGVKTLHKVASCPCQEGRLLYCVSVILLSWGFSCSPVSQSKEAALLTFLDLSNYKGDYRQDAQPIPILKCYGGAQQPSNSYISMTKLHPPYPN